MSLSDSRETRNLAFEMKFLVDEDTARCVREWARSALAPDPYGLGAWSDEYLTRTIYFDTACRDVLRRNRSFGRAKYRIRRYGASDVVFLERKLRTARQVTKRRTLIALPELSRLEQPEINPEWPGYWFHRRLLARRLEPVCQVSYSRMARVGRSEHGPVRVTLDEDLRVAPVDGIGFKAAAGLPTLDGRLVLELKYRFIMPAMLRRLVEDLRLDARAISKYRLGMAALGQLDADVAAAPGASGGAHA
jgi:hypothetical protein